MHSNVQCEKDRHIHIQFLFPRRNVLKRHNYDSLFERRSVSLRVLRVSFVTLSLSS
jgi:hypothetical protein